MGLVQDPHLMPGRVEIIGNPSANPWENPGNIYENRL